MRHCRPWDLGYLGLQVAAKASIVRHKSHLDSGHWWSWALGRRGVGVAVKVGMMRLDSPSFGHS